MERSARLYHAVVGSMVKALFVGRRDESGWPPNRSPGDVADDSVVHG